jgi:hypothetical protein
MSEIWMPGYFGNPHLPLNWEPGGIINSRIGNAQLGNRLCQLGRLPLGRPDSTPVTKLRLTQVSADVLRNTDPNVLLTSVQADVLRNVDSNVRSRRSSAKS